jgi:hypothetical protein
MEDFARPNEMPITTQQIKEYHCQNKSFSNSPVQLFLFLHLFLPLFLLLLLLLFLLLLSKRYLKCITPSLP